MTKHIKLVQLPIPQLARFSPSGNVPLAAGCLSVAAQQANLAGIEIETIDPATTERLGDEALAAELAAGEPTALGLSLYLWNTERSLHVAKRVKELSPRTRIVIGGPEVAPDNSFLLDNTAFDIAVTGEAESVFPRILERIAADSCAGGLPGVAVRGKNGLSPFRPAEPATFGLTTYPSPYLANRIPIEARRATYVETVRGCRSHCTFCFYPKSSASLRSLDIESSKALLTELAQRGAREIVFLDPTFNHRPDFDALLDAILEVNRERRLRFFAEVRAEGLTESHADKLAAAGFHKLEIGLQSVNPVALARSKRGGSAEIVARAAKLLGAQGIDLLVDLIVGLPGDERRHVEAGIDFLLAHGLGRHAQVFPLQILPGTAMRASAAQDGIEFDPRPPYRVIRTATLEGSEIEELLMLAEDRLERRLDENPRPFLSERDPELSPTDVLEIDLDQNASPPELDRPGAPHLALWFHGSDPWAERERIRSAIRTRLSIDPYAILDVVLKPRRPFPLNLLAHIRSALDVEPKGYASRAGFARGEDGARRITVVLERGRAFPVDWIESVRQEVPCFQEMTTEEAFHAGSKLNGELPAARILTRRAELAAPNAPDHIRALLVLCFPEDIAFADRELERRWVEESLGYRSDSP